MGRPIRRAWLVSKDIVGERGETVNGENAMSEATEGIGLRAELLAKLHLTRRLNVDVHPFDEGGKGTLELVCTIRSKEVRGFLPFGVMVWGTAKGLPTEDDATALARLRLKKTDRPMYCIPVIALVFSMENDEGYFCWIAEPCNETGKLLTVSRVRCKQFNAKQLDRITKRISDWYQIMQNDLIVEAEEASSSACPDGD